MRWGTTLLAALAAATAVEARAGDPPPPRLPFSDDVAPPPPLAVPLDRAFHGAIVDFDGDRITLRWDWGSPEQLSDFESFIPVRATLRGGFAVKDGRVAADGTAGIRVKLGFLSDLEVHVGPSVLSDPHDLGIVLPAPGSSDESIVCLVQDNLFTRFDGAAGHANMINKLGGIVASNSGMVEFRYVDRRTDPRIAPGAQVSFDVVRKGSDTAFTIAPKEGAVTLRGKDTDTPMTRFTPGLYVCGGAAEFGPLTISGRIDPAWCAEHGILPFVAGDLLYPGNRWKPAEKRAADEVERYVRQGADPAAAEAKGAVTAADVAGLVGDVKVPLVIRIRAAEALLDRDEASEVAERLAQLLDARDRPARTLAWQLLRARLPWDFRYEVDAEPRARRDAAQLIAAYLRERDDEESQGKVFVEGSWTTPQRADDMRSTWPHAWDLRTAHVRVRTDMEGKWASWYLKALEAEYAELVKLAGKEPPSSKLPLSVLVFKDAADFTEFCKANGYDMQASWDRFTDFDRNVSLATFHKKNGLADVMGLFAKQYLHFATGRFWPAWFDEGRASWFGNSDYATVGFDGTTLQVGIVGHAGATKELALAAVQDRMPSIVDVVAKDPRSIEQADQRRLWYVEAWALHAWLVDFAPAEVRRRFAEWQGVMETLSIPQRDVNDVGFKEFMVQYAKALPDMDAQFREWVKKL